MTKQGYHRILFPDDTTLEGPLVLVLEGTRPKAWHPLQGEEPAVIWRGGTYHATLQDKEIIQPTQRQ